MSRVETSPRSQPLPLVREPERRFDFQYLMPGSSDAFQATTLVLGIMLLFKNQDHADDDDTVTTYMLLKFYPKKRLWGCMR